MSTNSKELSPDSSPTEVSKSVGVRRVNNIPLYIVAGIMLVFLLLMMVVAMNRAIENNDQHDIGQDGEAESSSAFASLIAGDYIGGIIEPSAQPEVPDLAAPEIIIARPDNLDAPPLPPSVHGDEMSFNPDVEHIRMLKRQQFEEAIKAGTKVTMIAPRSSGSAPNQSNGITGTPSRSEALAEIARVRQQIDSQSDYDATGAYHARLAQIRQGGGLGVGDEDMGDDAPMLLDDSSTGAQNNYERFDSIGDEDRWKLDSKVKKPAAPYTLQTGFVIPATLISGINSSLPGQIMAQVSQNIYDSPVGKWRLIPQGSRLVGTYASEVEFGQARVLVAWQRIIFPDGKTMDIGAMPGADGVGYAGFRDQVNNHYLRIFGSALIMSAIVAGAAYSHRDSGGAFGRQNAGSIMSQSLGQQLGMVTANLIRRNLNISPTLEIRPGYRFNIIVTKDMVFNKPYQSFDY